MKPAPFDYIAATSVDMAAAALADGGDDAKIIAGGQSLVPLLNFRLLRPSILIDINRIEAWRSFQRPRPTSASAR